MGFRLFLFSFSLIVCLMSQSVKSDNTGSQLLDGINSYRASLNLTALSENSDADCLAEQFAIQLKSQPCTDSTDASTEAQVPNDPSFLTRCRNATTTQDEEVMLACVPGHVSDLVLTNFTKSRYNKYLNESKYVWAGIADGGDWVVVVLSTSIPAGHLIPILVDTSGTISASFSRFVMFVFLVFFHGVLM